MSKAAKKRKRLEALEAYVFLIPTLLGMVFLTIGAIIGAILLSFTDYSLKWPPSFIGLANFRDLFSDRLLPLVLSNTFWYLVMAVVPCVIFALFLSLLVNGKTRRTRVFRTIYFWPVVGSMTAIALVWRFLLNDTFGFVNYLIGMFGVQGPRWFASTTWALVGIAIIFVWKNVGYYMTILLSGLQNIPQDLNEAAIIDGAGLVRRTWYITLPLISPTMFFVIIMTSIASFQVFDSIMVINDRGGPANATTTLSFFIYQNAFSFMRMGYAAAAGVLLFFIVSIFSMVQFRLQNKWVFYG